MLFRPNGTLTVETCVTPFLISSRMPLTFADETPQPSPLRIHSVLAHRVSNYSK